jgi:hypothetical protein
MNVKTCNVFFKDEVDNRTKVVCVFDANASDEDMIKVISEHLKENEMGEDDEYYPPILSKKGCDNAAYKIVKGEMLDLDLDRYWLEKNVSMYIK